MAVGPKGTAEVCGNRVTASLSLGFKGGGGPSRSDSGMPSGPCPSEWDGEVDKVPSPGAPHGQSAIDHAIGVHYTAALE